MSTPTSSPGVTFDAGALIAIERGSPRMNALLRLVHENKLPVAVPAGVLAQAWRGGARQARIARLLAAESVDVAALDELAARGIGVLCGASGTSDVVDASVVLCARARGHRAVVTSDPGDLRVLDSGLDLVTP